MKFSKVLDFNGTGQGWWLWGCGLLFEICALFADVFVVLLELLVSIGGVVGGRSDEKFVVFLIAPRICCSQVAA